MARRRDGATASTARRLARQVRGLPRLGSLAALDPPTRPSHFGPLIPLPIWAQAVNGRGSRLGPRTLAAVPADTKNTPPSAPKQPGMPPFGSSPPMPHVEGAFDGHGNPGPRPAGQRPRSWPLPLTVSRETMSPPSGTYRHRRRPVSAYEWSSSVHVVLHIRVGADDHSQAQLTSPATIHKCSRS